MKILFTSLLMMVIAGFNRPERPPGGSFDHFLDSLCYQPDAVVKKALGISRKEKLYVLPGGGRWDRIRDMGLVRQYYQHVPTKEKAYWWPRYSLLMLGRKFFVKDTFDYRQEFRYLEEGKIMYGQSSFVVLEAGPPDECSGLFCRVMYYPVVGMYKSDTSMYSFVNVDDVTGLRYGDFKVLMSRWM